MRTAQPHPEHIHNTNSNIPGTKFWNNTDPASSYAQYGS